MFLSVGPGASSDAAKLNTPSPLFRGRFAVEAWSEFRWPNPICTGVLGWGIRRRKAVPEHVCIILKTDTFLEDL